MTVCGWWAVESPRLFYDQDGLKGLQWQVVNHIKRAPTGALLM
jgi:hypothetical protein